MTIENDDFRLKMVAKGKKPTYAQDPATDKLLSMVLVLAQELSVACDRIDTLEQVLEEKNYVERDKLVNYIPTKAVTAERDAKREKMLSRLFRATESEFQSMNKSSMT
jgi:hypothetical protein